MDDGSSAEETPPTPNDQDNVDDDDDDDDDDEPLVKYQRLGADVPSLAYMTPPDCPPSSTPPPATSLGSLTRVCVSPKSIAIGTSHGSVHLLDLAGNEVCRWQQHSGAVSDLSFDKRGEYIASTSEDGTCVVQSLLSDERESHWHDRPLRAVALDPTYAKRRSRRVCCGGLGAQLVISSKGWLGQRDHTLHAGEGAITACRWAGDAIAWCNDRGMKVYDVEAQHRVTFVPRPATAARASDPTLSFHANGEVLMLAWGPVVKVLRLRDPAAAASASAAAPATANGITPPAQHAQPKLRYAEVTASLDLEASCHVASVAPLGDWLLCLCRPWRDPSVSPLASDAVDDLSHGQPEVRIFDMRGNETCAPDGLPLRGFDAGFPPASVAGPGVLQLGWWHPDMPAGATNATSGEGHNFALWWGSASGEEPLYYILSCSDVVLARPRAADDHAQWLLSTQPDAEAAARFAHSNRRDAASGALVGPLTLGGVVSAETFARCVESRLTYLTVTCDPPRWTEAAACCAQYLDPMDTTTWEKWAFEFAQHRQLAALAEYLPVPAAERRASFYTSGSVGDTAVPASRTVSGKAQRLSSDCYEMTLAALVAWPLDARDNAARYLTLSRGASVLLRLLRQWPANLFDANKVAVGASATLARVEAGMSEASPVDAWPEFDMPIDANGVMDDGESLPESERTLKLESARLLREGLAELSLLGGKRAEALAHYLRLRRPGVFEFVERHGLHGLVLVGNIRALYACESAAAASASVASVDGMQPGHRPRADAKVTVSVSSTGPESPASALLASDAGATAVPPETVGVELVGTDAFRALQDSASRLIVPDTKGSRCLLAYLDHLVVLQPSSAGKLATAHVRLASALAPHRLLSLLRSSQSYPLEVALAECRARGLHAESVYLLERMGLHREALDVLVKDLNDVSGAARLATSGEVADASLWDDLVARACDDPNLAGELLECLATSTSTDGITSSSSCAGGQHISNAPAAARNLLRQLPDAMPVPHLRDRLRRCVEGVRTELSLHAGCAAIMRGDVSVLFSRKLKLARRGVGSGRVSVQ